MKLVNRENLFYVLAILLFILIASSCNNQIITSQDQPAVLEIREAGENSIRITLKPEGFREEFPYTPALVERDYPDPVISISKMGRSLSKRVGNMKIEVLADPLTVKVSDSDGNLIQELVFNDDGNLSFKLDESPVLGMGEGGPRAERGTDWRNQPIEFDRRGRFHNMYPRWQSTAYGSRNPVPLMIGTGGWALFVATPWGQVDLAQDSSGIFIPFKPQEGVEMQQSKNNQHDNLGKGIPPVEHYVPGLIDLFIFDASDPVALMKDISDISGPAVMPPKYSMGFMQSHRTLEDENQMLEIVDTFREKEIPLDVVIYLGTGFCPRGWNTMQPSYTFNPEVFYRQPAEVIADLHERNVKVSVHIVPEDRDELPTLTGSIPPREGEVVDESHIMNSWLKHTDLVEQGVDAWWPDEGDWFNLFERMKRHQLYYEGPLYTTPNVRPWSLHRNGYLGVARWGGWVWSGDTQSDWKTLEGQIAVGINHSLSLSPYWGSDIGGFYPGEELTAEMFARWFQFGAFCPSFRSHGRTWWTRLPWGWGLSERGPLEGGNLDVAELNNPDIEPVCREYARLRYQLLPYNYTLAWEARQTGMPFMRSMWLHYPDDRAAAEIGDQYLWGRDMLVAPVYEPGVKEREVYLPEGIWYDWFSNEAYKGGGLVTREVDLSIMPIFVRAGAIIPFDPVRQYTDQEVDEPSTLRVYSGSDGDYTLYEDDGISLEYLDGAYNLTNFRWEDDERRLTIEPGLQAEQGTEIEKVFRVEILPEGTTEEVTYKGTPVVITF